MYSILLEYLLLRPYSTLTRSNYFSSLRFLDEHEFESRQQLMERQWNKVKKLLCYAYLNVPFYKRTWSAAGIRPDAIQTPADFKKIPILTKKEIQNYRDELIAPQFPKNNLIKNATGGSTGEPLQFFTTTSRETYHAAAMALNYKWAGLHLGDKMAMLWGSSFDISKAHAMHERLKNALLRRKLLLAFNLSEQQLELYTNVLRDFKPRVLIGYVSALIRFAQFLEERNIHDIQIPSIITGAETLYPYQRTIFEQAFHGRVFNRYGGRDSGAVAAECPEQHQLHINSEIVYVESLPNQHLIITDLYNDAMPFIRYDVEDIGSVSMESCLCGRPTPLLVNLVGREHDIIVTRQGNAVPGEFFPHLFKDFRGIQQFQIIQDNPERLTMKIVKGSTFKKTDIDTVVAKTKKYLGDISITIEYVPVIEISASGKNRFTISHAHHPL